MKLLVGRFNTILSVVILTSALNFSYASSYDLEASGKTEAAALGNLKMSALRQGVSNALSKDEVKNNAKLLRNEIFLKVDKFTTVQGDVVYRVENNKTFAKGKVDVDDEAIVAVIKGLPLKDSSKSANEAVSSQPAVSQNSSEKKDSTTDLQETSKLASSDNSSVKQDSSTETTEVASTESSERKSEVQTETAKVENVPVQNKEEAVNKGASSMASASDNATVAKVVKASNTTIEQDTQFINLVNDRNPNDKKIAEELKKGANPNATKYLSGETEKAIQPPLWLYIYRKRNDAKLWIVKAFVEAGADINYVSPESKKSLAEFILRESTPEIAEYFFSLKPDISNIRVKPEFGYSCDLKKDSSVNLATYFADVINRKKKGLDPEAYLGVYKNILSLIPDINNNGGQTMMCLIRTTDFSSQRAYLDALLNAGVSPDSKVNMVGGEQGPLLFSALQYNDYELVNASVEHGADIKAKYTENKEEKTPLMFYLDKHTKGRHYIELSEEPFNINIVKTLVDAGADLYYETEDGKYSVASDFMDIGTEAYEYYLTLNPDLSKFKKNMADKWLYVVRKDKEIDKDKAFEIFKKQIELGCSTNYVDYRTPMIVEAYDVGGIEYLRYLLDKVSLQENDEFNTAGELVMKALSNNDIDAIKLMAEKKVNFNSVDNSGNPVLFRAIDDKKISSASIDALLDCGADINAVDNKGKTPLVYAITDRSSDDRTAVIQSLLKHKADPNVKYGKFERTPLMLEAEAYDGSAEVLGLLADAGADVNAVGTDGASALVFAIGRKSIPKVQMLINKGGDIKKALKIKGPMKIKKGDKTVTEEMSLKDILKESYKQAEAKGKVSEESKAFYDFIKKYF